MPRSRWIEFPSWRMRTLNLKDNKLLHYLPYRTFSAARYSSGEGEARRRSMLSSSTLKKVRSRSLYRWSFQLDIRNTDLVSPWAQDRDLGRNMLDPSEGHGERPAGRLGEVGSGSIADRLGGMGNLRNCCTSGIATVSPGIARNRPESPGIAAVIRL